MIEIFFIIEGIEQKEMAIFDSLKEMQYFIKNFKEQVLNEHPTATDIRLGQASVGIGN